MHASQHHAFELSPTTAAATQARTVLRDRFEPFTEAGSPFEVELVLSELVANAVEHGSGPITVCWTFNGAELRIEVTSRATESTPRVRQAQPHELHGRGLDIVATLASTWGHEVVEGRQTVWACIPLREPTTGDPAPLS